MNRREIPQEKLGELLRMAGSNPQVKKNLQQGNLEGVLKSLPAQDAQTVRNILSDPKQLQSILASPQVQQLIKQLKTENKFGINRKEDAQWHRVMISAQSWGKFSVPRSRCSRFKIWRAMLGLSPDTEAQGQNHVSAPPSSGDKEDGGLDPATIAAITSAFSKMGSLSREDSGVALLLALKPLLGEQRQKRVDEATKMLKLARILPLLQDAGIFRLDF